MGGLVHVPYRLDLLDDVVDEWQPPHMIIVLNITTID